MTDLLQTLLVEFRETMSTFTGGVAREISFPLIGNIKKIMVAIGMRRTGKTYFLFQIIQNLLKETPISRILYINFDDDRLLPMTQQTFGELIDAFYTLYPENHDQICYLFFDEIQNVNEWERVIRRYFDTKKVKIYLTGASAKLLSNEIHTSLRGRSFPIEIWPFSFTEFLAAKQIDMPDELLGKSNLDKLKGHLNLYLEQGGFPESVLLGHQIPTLDKKDHLVDSIEDALRRIEDGSYGYSDDKPLITPQQTEYFRRRLLNWRDQLLSEDTMAQNRRSILQGYVSTVILRDIMERYNIRNPAVIKYLVKNLLTNVGGNFTINKFFQDIKSQGFQVSKDTVYPYLEHISDAYLAFAISIYDESLRKRETNHKKIYAVDPGLARAYTMGRTGNIGHHFENLIYLDLRRNKYKEIYYHRTKTGKEVDFMAQDGLGKWHLYQVCWNLNDPKTLERETSALNEAEKELRIKGQIITPDSYFTTFLPSLRI